MSLKRWSMALAVLALVGFLGTVLTGCPSTGKRDDGHNHSH